MDMHTMPRFLNNEVAIPTNDSTTPKYDPFSGGGSFPGQGNYDVSFAVDPLNPHIVYMGGTVDGPPTGFLRIDTTGVSDPYALFLASDRNTTASGVTDNGRPRNTIADPISAKG